MHTCHHVKCAADCDDCWMSGMCICVASQSLIVLNYNVSLLQCNVKISDDTRTLWLPTESA